MLQVRFLCGLDDLHTYANPLLLYVCNVCMYVCSMYVSYDMTTENVDDDDDDDVVLVWILVIHVHSLRLISYKQCLLH